VKTRAYRPSSGTEGILFDDAWCSQCQHDADWRADGNAEPCEIFSRTFLYRVDDPDYPKEWIQDDVAGLDTRPRCTAFVAIGDQISSYTKDERQIELKL
jgi:hypothetical protein